MRDRKLFKPGLYDISNEEYHASAGISRSGILEFKKSPKHFWHKYINPAYVSKPATPALLFGSAVHCYILEPEKFRKEYFISEKNPHHGSSTLGKAYKADMLERSAGKILLEMEDFNEIVRMADVLQSDPQANQLISDAQYEKSIYWIDPATQLLCKVRPDIMHNNFIVDLKTTNDASYREFQRSFYNYGYHLQLAMMHEAIMHTQDKYMSNFIDLAIEKTEPYAYAIYPIDESAIEQGLNEFHLYLSQMKECFDKNNWPSYKTQTLSLPAYAKIEE